MNHKYSTLSIKNNKYCFIYTSSLINSLWNYTLISANVEYLFSDLFTIKILIFSVYVYTRKEAGESGDDNCFSCKICGIVYENKNSYTMHQKKDMVCGTNEMLPCLFCDSFQSRRKGDLNRHIARKHSDKFKDI